MKASGAHAEKNPGQQNWPGLMAGMTPMPSGFAKGEMNRLAVRRRQVIASDFYRDWLPGGCLKNSGIFRVNPGFGLDKRNFSIAVAGVIGVFFAALMPHGLPRKTGRKLTAHVTDAQNHSERRESHAAMKSRCELARIEPKRYLKQAMKEISQKREMGHFS